MRRTPSFVQQRQDARDGVRKELKAVARAGAGVNNIPAGPLRG